MLTNEELQAIKARCDAATAGKWVEGLRELDHALVMSGETALAIVKHDNDACFCARARADIPALLAHIDHQQRALEWMAKRSLSYAGESAENFQSICNFALLATNGVKAG